MTTARTGLTALLLAGALPISAQAQAICSAPHSSPTLAHTGAIGTLPTAAGWIQLSVYAQRATEGFNPLGQRQEFIGRSEFDTRSVYLTGAYGLLNGLEVWAQLPVHRLTVEGSAGRSEGSGVGDVRAAVRLSPALVGRDWPIAARLGVKVPGSGFPVDARVLPLTEGQRDIEISLESGWSPLEIPIYIVGWVGYRWRGENEGARFEPGDERFAHAAIGGWMGPLGFELGVDALWGLSPKDLGLTLDGARRRLVQLLPTVGSDLGPGRLEVTSPIPVAGRNLPAGIGLSVGYRAVWGIS